MTTLTIGDLARHPDRACATVDPAVMFATNDAGVGTARRICASCPLAADCLDIVLRLEGYLLASDRHGIQGGHRPADRARLARYRPPAATHEPNGRPTRQTGSPGTCSSCTAPFTFYGQGGAPVRCEACELDQIRLATIAPNGRRPAELRTGTCADCHADVSTVGPGPLPRRCPPCTDRYRRALDSATGGRSRRRRAAATRREVLATS